MGACNFEHQVEGTDLEALFNDLAEQSRYDSGNSYSGEIGMKISVVLRSDKLMTLKEAEEFAETDVDNNGKWDKDAFAVKWADEQGNHAGYIIYGVASS
jgi:hypothetical protein